MMRQPTLSSKQPVDLAPVFLEQPASHDELTQVDHFAHRQDADGSGLAIEKGVLSKSRSSEPTFSAPQLKAVGVLALAVAASTGVALVGRSLLNSVGSERLTLLSNQDLQSVGPPPSSVIRRRPTAVSPLEELEDGSIEPTPRPRKHRNYRPPLKTRLNRGFENAGAAPVVTAEPIPIVVAAVPVMPLSVEPKVAASTPLKSPLLQSPSLKSLPNKAPTIPNPDGNSAKNPSPPTAVAATPNPGAGQPVPAQNPSNNQPETQSELESPVTPEASGEPQDNSPATTQDNSPATTPDSKHTQPQTKPQTKPQDPPQKVPQEAPTITPKIEPPEAKIELEQSPTVQPPKPPPRQVAILPPIDPIKAVESIYVKDLKITGNTRFSDAQIAAVVQKTLEPEPVASQIAAAPIDLKQINRRLTPAQLVQISDAITKLYNQGCPESKLADAKETKRGKLPCYINSGAYVPAEVLQAQDGTAEVRIVEGKIAKIDIKMEPSGFPGLLALDLRPSYIQSRLQRATKGTLELSNLVNAVKLLEQDPLIAKINVELAPGVETGTSNLNVTVKQANFAGSKYLIDNSRSSSIGSLRQQIGVSQANLLGLGDQLTLGYNWTKGSKTWEAGYTLPINARNGRLSFNYSFGQSRVVEAPFGDLDIKSKSHNYELALWQPLKQTPDETLAISIKGTHYSNLGRFLETLNDGFELPFPSEGADEQGRTRVTALRFGQEWIKRGERNVFSLQSEFSLGVNALGARRLLQESDRRSPDNQFVAWKGQGLWVHSLAPDTLFSLRGQLQFADRALVPVEQFAIGGVDTVRGYRTNSLLTDNGWLISAELSLPVLRIPRWNSRVDVVPFFDLGQGWNRGDEQPDLKRLASLGLGLRWKLGDKFQAKVDWGVPLGETQVGGRSLRNGLNFSILFSP
jgi:hemolysin activation/secretion protein